MRKSVFFMAVLLALATGGIFAQASTSTARHWIAGEVSLVGAGIRYEFMLSPKMSIGVDAYWQSFMFFWNDLDAVAAFRYYIFKGLFAEIGAGFGLHTGTISYDYTVNGTKYTGDFFGSITGGAIVPGIGWKFDVGNPGGFFVAPLVQIPITLGMTETYNSSDKSRFDVGIGFRVSCALGWAF